MNLHKFVTRQSRHEHHQTFQLHGAYLSSSLSQTQKLVEDGDIGGAKMEYQTSDCCGVATYGWCVVVSLLVFMAVGLVAIVYIKLAVAAHERGS